MPATTQPCHLPLGPDALREVDPDPKRLLLWVRGGRKGRFQHWERVVGRLPEWGFGGDALAAIPVRVTPFRQRLRGDLQQFFRRFWGERNGPPRRYILPTGEWAELAAGAREDAVLLWAPEGGETTGQGFIAEHWPAAEGWNQLGPNLFLVLGVDPATCPAPREPAPEEAMDPGPAPTAGEGPGLDLSDDEIPGPEDEFRRLRKEIDGLQEQGLWPEALARARHLLEWVRGQWGEDHPLVLTGLNQLGWLHQLQGDPAAAETFYRQALDLHCSEGGNDHPNHATSMNNLALLCQARGDREEAESLNRRALTIRHGWLGDEHPLVAVSLNNIALLYHAAGRADTAGQILGQSLNIFRATLGESHPDFITCLENLVHWLRAIGREDAADQFAELVERNRQATEGKDLPRVADSLNILARWEDTLMPSLEQVPGPEAEETPAEEPPGVVVHSSPESQAGNWEATIPADLHMETGQPETAGPEGDLSSPQEMAIVAEADPGPGVQEISSETGLLPPPEEPLSGSSEIQEEESPATMFLEAIPPIAPEALEVIQPSVEVFEESLSEQDSGVSEPAAEAENLPPAPTPVAEEISPEPVFPEPEAIDADPAITGPVEETPEVSEVEPPAAAILPEPESDAAPEWSEEEPSEALPVVGTGDPDLAASALPEAVLLTEEDLSAQGISPGEVFPQAILLGPGPQAMEPLDPEPLSEEQAEQSLPPRDSLSEETSRPEEEPNRPETDQAAEAGEPPALPSPEAEMDELLEELEHTPFEEAVLEQVEEPLTRLGSANPGEAGESSASLEAGMGSEPSNAVDPEGIPGELPDFEAREEEWAAALLDGDEGTTEAAELLNPAEIPGEEQFEEKGLIAVQEPALEVESREAEKEPEPDLPAVPFLCHEEAASEEPLAPADADLVPAGGSFEVVAASPGPVEISCISSPSDGSPPAPDGGVPPPSLLEIAEGSAEPEPAREEVPFFEMPPESPRVAEPPAPQQPEHEEPVGGTREEAPAIEPFENVGVDNHLVVLEPGPEVGGPDFYAPPVMSATHGPEDLPAAADLTRRAEALRAAGDLASAEALFQEAVEIFQAVREGEESARALALAGLARAYAATGRASEALELLEQALDAESRAGGPHRTVARRVQTRLAQLLSLACNELADSPQAARAALDAVLRPKAAGEAGREPALVNRQEVALALPAGSALVEFACVPLFDFEAGAAPAACPWRPAHYLALVLPAGEPDRVSLIDLGEAETIDRQVAEFHTCLTGASERGEASRPLQRGSRARRDFLAAGTRLRRSVFDPLEEALGGRSRLFLAPAGELACLPFEVLPVDEERHLLDTHTLSYLLAGRDVLRFRGGPAREAAPAVVAADPDFNHSGEDLPVLRARARGTAPAFRPFRGEDEPAGFAPLLGTRRCALAVADLLGVEPWLAKAVRKDRFQALRSPRILHLATHCFPATNGAAGANGKGVPKESGDDLAPERPGKPLALALAGANRRRPGTELPEEDSFLTPAEVAGLHLADTELVVLPGSVAGSGGPNGPSALGLLSAFGRAGAATLVASRWKVADWYAKELLLDFYDRLLVGEPRAEALRGAQLALKERYPHQPACWGAFVCQGDPRPLLGTPAVATRRAAI